MTKKETPLEREITNSSVSEKESLLKSTEEDIDNLKKELLDLGKESTDFLRKKEELFLKRKELLRKKTDLEEDLQKVLQKESEVKAQERSIEEKEKQESDPEKRREIEKSRWEVEDKRRAVEDERWEWDKKIEEITSEIRAVEEDLNYYQRVKKEENITEGKKELSRLIEAKQKEINSLKEDILSLKKKERMVEVQEKERVRKEEEEKQRAEQERKQKEIQEKKKMEEEKIRLEKEKSKEENKRKKLQSLYELAVSEYEKESFGPAKEKFAQVIEEFGPFEKAGLFGSLFGKEKPLPQKAEEYLKKMEDNERKKEAEEVKKEQDLVKQIREAAKKYKREKEKEASKREPAPKKKQRIVTQKEKEDILPETENLHKEIERIKDKRRNVEKSIQDVLLRRTEVLEEKETLVSEHKQKKEDLASVLEKEKEVEKREKETERQGRLAGNVEEEKQAEKERWAVEEERKQTKELRWNKEEEVKKAEEELKAKEKEFQNIESEREALERNLGVMTVEIEEKKDEIKDVTKKLEEEKKTREKYEKDVKDLYQRALENINSEKLDVALHQLRSVEKKRGNLLPSCTKQIKELEKKIASKKKEEEIEKVREEEETKKREADKERLAVEQVRAEAKKREEVSKAAREKQEESDRATKEDEMKIKKEIDEKELFERAEKNYKDNKKEISIHQFRSVEKAKGKLSSEAEKRIKTIEKEIGKDEKGTTYEVRRNGGGLSEKIARVKAYFQGSQFAGELFTATRYPIVGVDISDHSIEVLHLNKQRVTLAYGRSVMEEGVVQNGEILNPKKLKELIKETLKNTKPMPLETQKGVKIKAIISLPESRVFIRQFRINGGGNVMEKIKERMTETIPLPIDELYFNYHFISSPKNGKTSVLCIAVQKVIVQKYIELLKSADIDPVAFDVESSSLGRALIIDVKNSKDMEIAEEERNEMIVDIGARTTVLSVFCNSSLSLSVSLPYGGSYFSSKVAEELGLAKEEAEKKKQKVGFNEDLLPILSKQADKIIKEIKDAEKYYKREFKQEVGKIILAGGSSLLPGILDYFKSVLGERVELGDPLIKIEGRKVLQGKESILFANVIGLALRGTGKDPVKEGINLLPEEMKVKERKTQQEKQRSVLLIAVFITISGLMLLALSIYYLVYLPVPPPLIPLKDRILVMMDQGERVEENMFVIGMREEDEEGLPVYRGPGEDNEVVGRVFFGESYLMLQRMGSWYSIDLGDGTSGWIPMSYSFERETEIVDTDEEHQEEQQQEE